MKASRDRKRSYRDLEGQVIKRSRNAFDVLSQAANVSDIRSDNMALTTPKNLFENAKSLQTPQILQTRSLYPSNANIKTGFIHIFGLPLTQQLDTQIIHLVEPENTYKVVTEIQIYMVVQQHQLSMIGLIILLLKQDGIKDQGS